MLSLIAAGAICTMTILGGLGYDVKDSGDLTTAGYGKYIGRPDSERAHGTVSAYMECGAGGGWFVRPLNYDHWSNLTDGFDGMIWDSDFISIKAGYTFDLF